MNMPPAHTEVYKGLTIRIEYDSDPSNPRTDQDNASRMVCWCRRYNLGDEQPKRDVRDYLLGLAHKVAPRLDEDKIPDTHLTALLQKHYLILPLYLFDHSGISISTGAFSCPWDSGQVGFVYMSREDVAKNYMLPLETLDWNAPYGEGDKRKPLREWAIDLMNAEVDEYDCYLKGEVYGYVIEDEDGNHLDSCWGFIDPENDWKYCLEEAKSLADHIVERLCVGANI